jgi:signal transduction histidine kinase
VRPILDLSRASEAIGRGEYAVRVPNPPSGAGPELALLANRFNAMATDVERQEASRRRFVADAAHELKTPLALLRARIEMLESGVYAPDAEQWAALGRSVHRIDRLVADLQLLARIDAGKLEIQPTMIDLPAFARAHVESYEPYAREHEVTVRYEGQTAIGTSRATTVRFDRDRLARVLDNLLSNAIRHSPPGGTVTVRTTAADRSIELIVEDEGPGIAPSDRERIFQRFVRLDSAR